MTPAHSEFPDRHAPTNVNQIWYEGTPLLGYPRRFVHNRVIELKHDHLTVKVPDISLTELLEEIALQGDLTPMVNTSLKEKEAFDQRR